jgi:hypothetical protein
LRLTVFNSNSSRYIAKIIQKTILFSLKEVKIKIQGDKVSDAGGLLWEWMHLIVAEIFHPNTGIIFTQLTGLFIKCDSEDI